MVFAVALTILRAGCLARTTTAPGCPGAGPLLSGPRSSLPLFVFGQASSAFGAAVDGAWAGALTLIAVVVILTVAAQRITRRNRLVWR